MKKIKNIKGDGPNAVRGLFRGGAKGAAIGTGIGLALAPLTFGLSIPAGAAIGTGVGAIAGSRKENKNSQRNINVANAASAMAEHEAKVANSTPAPVVEDAPVVDPVQDELSRQRDEVMAGNVNSAQADYFREQNEGLFMKEGKGANPSLSYNKSEKITGVNPVSNREDKMTKLFGGLYGSEESRGIL